MSYISSTWFSVCMIIDFKFLANFRLFDLLSIYSWDLTRKVRLELKYLPSELMQFTRKFFRQITRGNTINKSFNDFLLKFGTHGICSEKRFPSRKLKMNLMKWSVLVQFTEQNLYDLTKNIQIWLVILNFVKRLVTCNVHGERRM